MASLNRDELIDIWKNAKSIHAESRLNSVRRAARRIGMAIEKVTGQLASNGGDAEYWKVD